MGQREDKPLELARPPTAGVQRTSGRTMEEPEWKTNLRQAEQQEAEVASLGGHAAVLALEAAALTLVTGWFTDAAVDRTHRVDFLAWFGVMGALLLVLALFFGAGARSDPRGPRVVEDGGRRRSLQHRHGVTSGMFHEEDHRDRHAHRTRGGIGLGAGFLGLGMVFLVNEWVALKSRRLFHWWLAVVVTLAIGARSEHRTHQLTPDMKKAILIERAMKDAAERRQHHR